MTDTSQTPRAPSLGLGGFPGLTEQEALRRIKHEGPNELPSREKRGLLAIAWEVIREPMFLMLVAANKWIAGLIRMGAPVKWESAYRKESCVMTPHDRFWLSLTMD